MTKARKKGTEGLNNNPSVPFNAYEPIEADRSLG